jgi:signal transduction histidine kinase
VVVLLAGSVLHDYLWPSAYGGGLLTTADALSLVFAVVVATGGISELRHIASERARLLATERERARRLEAINALRSDFSAMVAHELDTPKAAVRKLNEMLCAGGRTPGCAGTPRRRRSGSSTPWPTSSATCGRSLRSSARGSRSRRTVFR